MSKERRHSISQQHTYTATTAVVVHGVYNGSTNTLAPECTNGCHYFQHHPQLMGIVQQYAYESPPVCVHLSYVLLILQSVCLYGNPRTEEKVPGCSGHNKRQQTQRYQKNNPTPLSNKAAPCLQANRCLRENNCRFTPQKSEIQVPFIVPETATIERCKKRTKTQQERDV
ncbi:hypothetical protein LSM04_007314 [Trypanosoma melophagium]|uniref:uncharacterized protein n=1 Tax=Trypanosoma melophagium TaxID=715481 RepID=UPI00351A4229|nr:hypothetical protein LSM04_002226 [Trypanosoma melophagium]KAH9598214.1 hypothetical protein LSM04_007314 [Trypanosoma melophagium]